MGLLPMDDFVNSHTGHLEDTGSLSYATIPDVVTFHYTVSEKSHTYYHS